MSVFRHLSRTLGAPVYLLEKESRLGSGISSRNSGVIHTGLHGDESSCKRIYCARGREMIYEYCRSRGIRHEQCGKLIVATSDAEMSVVENFANVGRSIGVDAKMLQSSSEVKSFEPNVEAVGGCFFPTTGVLDVQGLVDNLEMDGLEHGVESHVLTESEIVNVCRKGEGWVCTVRQGKGDSATTYDVECGWVVNCAGPDATAVYSELRGDLRFRHYFCRGHYFAGNSALKKIVNALVYPVPTKDKAGLGIHATKGVTGEVMFGPNTDWMSPSQASTDSQCWMISEEETEAMQSMFVRSISSYLPCIQDHEIRYSHCGIRPKLSHPDLPNFSQTDFHVKQDEDGWINCFGIESPGVTSCMRIAEVVGEIMTAD